MGFDVCVTLTRPGKRISLRKRAKSKIPKRHRVTLEETLEFAKNLGVKIEEEA